MDFFSIMQPLLFSVNQSIRSKVIDQSGDSLGHAIDQSELRNDKLVVICSQSTARHEPLFCDLIDQFVRRNRGPGSSTIYGQPKALVICVQNSSYAYTGASSTAPPSAAIFGFGSKVTNAVTYLNLPEKLQIETRKWIEGEQNSIQTDLTEFLSVRAIELINDAVAEFRASCSVDGVRGSSSNNCAVFIDNVTALASLAGSGKGLRGCQTLIDCLLAPVPLTGPVASDCLGSGDTTTDRQPEQFVFCFSLVVLGGSQVPAVLDGGVSQEGDAEQVDGSAIGGSRRPRMVVGETEDDDTCCDAFELRLRRFWRHWQTRADVVVRVTPLTTGYTAMLDGQLTITEQSTIQLPLRTNTTTAAAEPFYCSFKTARPSDVKHFHFLADGRRIVVYPPGTSNLVT